jgi:hypothetical protein
MSHLYSVIDVILLYLYSVVDVTLLYLYSVIDVTLLYLYSVIDVTLLYLYSGTTNKSIVYPLLVSLLILHWYLDKY